jgi:tRNA1Val (adenine37-N6)-methyltransferase
MKIATSDSFFNGRIRVKQDPTGYRFSIDAILLASQIRAHPGERILDLGTGCGIVAMILAYRNPEIMVYAVEVQKQLFELAESNVKDNRMSERITVINCDMKSLSPKMISGSADIVACNPPYRRSTSGRLNPVQQRAIARHEILATLSDVLSAARRMLRTAGRFVTIYTAERTAELLAKMKTNRIEPKIIRTIHSNPIAEAKMILVEGIKDGGPGTIIQAPLILYDKDGQYSREVRQMFAP